MPKSYRYLVISTHAPDTVRKQARIPWCAVPDGGGRQGVGDRLDVVHEWLGNAMMSLIALHVSASLWPKFVHCDNTLARMW
jgi:cytochrome b561